MFTMAWRKLKTNLVFRELIIVLCFLLSAKLTPQTPDYCTDLGN